MLGAYAAWVRGHAGLVSGVEGALASAVWLLPDRFSDSELKAEALSAGLGLLSLFNAVIVEPGRVGGGDADSGGRCPLMLAALQQVEVLLEIGADHWLCKTAGGSGWRKYDVLCCLELLKLALRVATLRGDGGRLLLDGSATKDGYAAGSAHETSRAEGLQAVAPAFARFRAKHCEERAPAEAAVTVATAAAGAAAKDEAAEAAGSVPDGATAAGAECAGKGGYWWDGPPGGKAGAGLAGHWKRGGKPYWWDAEEAAAACEGGELAAGRREGSGSLPAVPVGATRQTGQRQHTAPLLRMRAGKELVALGELLHLARPLLYCLLLRRYGVRSWRPWALSLLADLASAQAISLGATLSNPRQSWLYRQQYRSPTYARSAQAIAWTPAERSERARRRLALLYYLLRSPAFEGVTRPMLQRAQGVLSYVPLVGSITGKGLEIMEGIQQYYTYTAAS